MIGAGSVWIQLCGRYEESNVWGRRRNLVVGLMWITGREWFFLSFLTVVLYDYRLSQSIFAFYSPIGFFLARKNFRWVFIKRGFDGGFYEVAC